MIGKLKKIMPAPVTPKIVSAAATFFSNLVRTRLFNVSPRRGPLFVTWLVTFECNAFCRFCGTHNLKKQFPDDLGRERSLAVAHEIGKSGVWVVGFTGGEVLMWPHLFDVISVLKQYGIAVYFVTNGLTLKENAAEIIRSGVDYIVVSIDSDEAAEHDSLRNVSGLFQKALEGMKHLRATRHGDRPLIKTTTILAKHSLAKADKILSLLNDYADVTSIQPIANDYANGPHNRSDSAINFLTFEAAERDVVERELAKFMLRHSEFNNAYFRGIPDYWFSPDRLKEKIHCWSPFLRLQIMPNGDVFHCTANPRYHAAGNLKTSSFIEIWSGKILRQQREEIRCHENHCICWTQDSSFNALFNSIPLLNKLPVINRNSRKTKL